MKTEDIALPWFPITPDYIDLYLDSVLKYLRDFRTAAGSDSNSPDDSSYRTTVGLLFQRAEQLCAAVRGRSLQKARTMSQEALSGEVRILAASALLKEDGTKIGDLAAMTYLLSLLRPEVSDRLVPCLLALTNADAVEQVGYSLDDVIRFDPLRMVQALAEGMKLRENPEDKWYENHGTVRAGREGLTLFGENKYMLDFKSRDAFKAGLSVENGALTIQQGKKVKAPFNPAAFLKEIEGLVPQEREAEKKIYEDGEMLTVRVLNRGYDEIYAESTDPAYEPVRGRVEIDERGGNVRGLYLTDISRNVSINTLLNVEYRKDTESFSVDRTILDFIYDYFWKQDENEQRYMRMKAILLFPCGNRARNTWLTENGFLVRTGYEDLERYAFHYLDIQDYDETTDFFLAEVAEEAPAEDRFDERTVKDDLIKLILHLSKSIVTEMPKTKTVRRIDPAMLTLLHRMLAVKEEAVVRRSAEKEEYLGACCALAGITGDESDLDEYLFSHAYRQALAAFARMRFREVALPEEKLPEGDRTHWRQRLVAVLREYGQPQESELLRQEIERGGEDDIADVAKLVQASNRFIGSPSLERLRGDLHREICAILGVADAIELRPDEMADADFPFPPEDDRTEHKMSWIYDNETSEANETAQSAKIMKTLCAFMNRDPDGGEAHLYIGTDEKRRFVSGIQEDIDFLVSKGEIDSGGDPEDAYLRHVAAAVRHRFPEQFHYVKARLCADGKVLDLGVEPAAEGIVYFDEVAYYRYGSESRKMPDHVKKEILDRKFFQRSGLAAMQDAVRRAIRLRKTVVLKSYESSHGNSSGEDRELELHAFVDNGRYDAVWAYDYVAREKKNKVFLLKRSSGVELLDRPWKFEKQHRTYQLDMFGFYGEEKIPFDVTLLSIRAKNFLHERFPDTRDFTEPLPDKRWRVRGELFNTLSLGAACGCYLSMADDMDISASPGLKEYVSNRLNELIDKL